MSIQQENKINRFAKKGNNTVERLVTPKGLAIFTTAAYIFSLIPLLWIAWYNYPSADDYSVGSKCHQVWMATHNVFAVIWQGIVGTADEWVNWMGCFTSNFFTAVSPSAFGERFCVLNTWIILAALSFSTMYLFHCIFVKVFHASRYLSHSVSMLMLLVSVQCMCPAGRGEAFYWYSGAVNYIFLHSMSLVFWGLLISAALDQRKRRIRNICVLSLLGFLIGGGNQMTALNVSIILMVSVVMMLFYKKWKSHKILCIPMISFFMGFALSIASPGNWIRAAKTNGMNPVKAVLVSFYDCLDRAMNQWTTWTVILIMIALIPLFWHMAKNTSFRFPRPLAVVFFGFCLASAMMTPSLFAVGGMDAGRIQALTYLMYILLLTLCVGYVTGWFRQRWDGADIENLKESKDGEKEFSSATCWCLLGCLAFFAFASLLTVIPEPHYYTFSSALTELSNGNAKAYGDALRERMEIYRSAPKEGIVEVDPLPVQPQLLYFSDIKEDPEDWENRGLSRYYGFEAVKVRKSETNTKQ